jgi:predicted anti-sigma-YlaC factor YlaD
MAMLALALLVAGCSPRRFAAARVADALAAGGSGWGTDDDPAVVGAALPFALKTYESLLAEVPDKPNLLVATCRGYVSYATGWVEAEAERLEASDFERARRERQRALKLNLRARDYCLRALDLRWPGIREKLARDPAAALRTAKRRDVELLYWTGAAWGAAIGLGLDRPELVADLPAVRALFERALALQPDFDRGALHEAMIPVESVSELLGGSPARAREHFERAVELSGGLRVSPYVAWARGVPVARQDRAEFRRALEAALAVDPEASPADRLANHLARERAERLLARADDLFYAEE